MELVGGQETSKAAGPGGPVNPLGPNGPRLAACSTPKEPQHGLGAAGLVL